MIELALVATLLMGITHEATIPSILLPNLVLLDWVPVWVSTDCTLLSVPIEVVTPANPNLPIGYRIDLAYGWHNGRQQRV